MRVVDLIQSSCSTVFSMRMLPPVKVTGIEQLYAQVEKLMDFALQYINITTRRKEHVYQEKGNGMYAQTWTARCPGTIATAAAPHNKYGVTTVPYITYSGMTRQETEDTSSDLSALKHRRRY